MWNAPVSSAFGPKKYSRRTLMNRALAVGLSLSAPALLLQGCSGSGTLESSLNFTNWASAETATRTNIDKALAIFESQNNVQVNNIGMPFDEVLSQLTQMIKAHITLDVMELSGNVPYVLAGMGALADLGPFVPQDWTEDAFTSSFAAGTYDEVLYAVPFSITPHAFWYSKVLMAQAGLDSTQPPRTINELNQAMTVLRAKLPANVYPIALDTSITEYALIGFWPWIWTFGGEPMLDNGHGQMSINWADTGTVAAFQWLQDAVRNKWTPANTAIKAEREMMAEGNVVFKLDGPYLTGILGSINPDFHTSELVNETFAVTTTPLGPGRSQPVTCADIHNLGIGSTSANKELAWKLINFLTTSPAVITTFLIPEGGMLPRKSYNIKPQLYRSYYSDAISQTFIYDVIPTMRTPAFGPRYSQAAMAVVTALHEIANGAEVRPRLLQLTDEVKSIYL
ncbi:MAG TPA: extracellular solute-binding protein [Ktedonobacteraceae bacterium]|nr:extracellular solute-binding protein [Ktedonobacteraceae bacterium]